MRLRRGAVLLMLGAAAVSAAGAAAAPRIHRTTLPPPPPLPTQLAVDETEWSVTPSRRVVASGTVRIQVYNRGMDDHDLAVVDATGVRRAIELAPRSSGELVVDLAPGRQKLWCSLFEGTSQSHEDLGMVAFIEARPQAPVAAARERLRRARR